MKKKNLTIAAIVIVAVIGIFLFNRDISQTETTPPGSGSERPVIEFLTTSTLEIERDYNQDCMIAIKNHGPGMAELRMSATPREADILASFVGRGTTEWHEVGTTVGIPEGETWELPILLHADRSTKGLYEIDLQASLPDGTKTYHTVKVKVIRSELNLSTRWENAGSELDEARLARWLIIKNEGNTVVSDLAVTFKHEGTIADEKLQWSEMIERYQLAPNHILRVKIAPRLYPAFTELQGELVLTGIDQQHVVPYLVKVPDGKQIFVTLSRTTRSSSGKGKRCTNRPSVSYPVSPTEGTGGEWTPYSGGGGGGGALRPPTPDSTSPGADSNKDEEDDDDGGFDWRPSGVGNEGDSDDADSSNNSDRSMDESAMTPEQKEEARKKREAKRKKEEAKESEDDNATFDHLDDNAEGVRGGFIPAASNGTSNDALGRKIVSGPLDPTKLVDGPRIAMEAMKLLKEDGDGVKAERRKKESSTHVDKNGRKTHMTRRTRPDGTEFLNFGFGIQKGVRKKVPMRIPGYIGQPTMGPRPGVDGGAIAAFTRKDGKNGQVVEIVDPQTGKKTTLGNGMTDSPRLVANGPNTDAFFRENGELKRVSIAPGLKTAPSRQWPTDKVKLGPLLNAKVSPSGVPHVVSRERDGVAINTPAGKTLHQATSADVGFLKDGKSITTLRQPDGGISAIMPGGGRVPLVNAHPGNGAPTLTKTGDDRLRMFFSRELPKEGGAATKGLEAGGAFSIDYKDGKWTQPRRQLMPNAEVEEAAVITSFELPYGHAHYKPMDTKVFVNGNQVGEMKEKIPAGRYIFPVNPNDLNFASRNSKEKNNILIKAKGIGPGNFHFSDKVGLYTRHKLCQDCLAAESPEAAEKLAHQSDDSIRHSSPDLIVASNGYQLPKDASPGQEVDVRLSLFNAGDKPSKSGKLKAFINNRELGAADFKGITPFRGKHVPMKVKLPVDWKKGSSLKMSVRAPRDGDSDPSNNDLDFYILKAANQKIADRAKPLRIDPAKLDQSLITEVTAGTKSKPLKVNLKAGTHWYKIGSGAGALQVDVIGTAARDLHRMHLFDAQGQQVKSSPVKGPFYLQVNAPRSGTENTTINFWWE